MPVTIRWQLDRETADGLSPDTSTTVKARAVPAGLVAPTNAHRPARLSALSRDQVIVQSETAPC
ncbi:hypothetical protein FRAHR75_570022 [Frankia sp. Hr75.2]|nr:hypothetical protein FRAHR75_570022 [Frankia sp. Hr75.2]